MLATIYRGLFPSGGNYIVQGSYLYSTLYQVGAFGLNNFRFRVATLNGVCGNNKIRVFATFTIALAGILFSVFGP